MIGSSSIMAGSYDLSYGNVFFAGQPY